ncbi:MAG: cell division protein FtsX [Burkholderiales bacterium]
MQAIDSRLKAHPQVAALRYVPRDRALEELKRTTGNSGIAEGLADNPLPDAFVIDARDATPAAVQRLKAELAAWPKVAHGETSRTPNHCECLLTTQAAEC